MALRFFRRKNIVPGVRLNFSKSGVSPSIGVPGARVTIGGKGIRKTVGIPGTGLFYIELGRSGGGGVRVNLGDTTDEIFLNTDPADGPGQAVLRRNGRERVLLGRRLVPDIGKIEQEPLED